MTAIDRSTLHIGPMTDEEVGILGRWAADEGWNPGRNDLDIARAIDPEAFIALRRGNELLGGGSIFSYDGRFGFMGLFILRADVRGQGLGAWLWQTRARLLEQRLQPGAGIGMDGVFAMVPFYARGGFNLAYHDLRFEGDVPTLSEPDGLSELSSVAFETIAAYDRDCVATPRDRFLKAWLAQPGAIGRCIHENGVLRAYGLLRPCVTGYKIGPLFADTPDHAERLLTGLLARIPGQRVQIDVPEPNAAGLALAGRFGLTESFGCARMYKGPAPELPVERIFGVTSLEFG